MYRECALVLNGMSPAEVNAHEIWEIAAALGRNEPDEREAWPADAPSQQTMFRMLRRMKGEPLPEEGDKPTDDEYVEMLQHARSGTRTAVT